MTGCCTLVAMSVLNFSNLQQPLFLVVLTRVSLVPSWFILIALSLLRPPSSEGQLD